MNYLQTMFFSFLLFVVVTNRGYSKETVVQAEKEGNQLYIYFSILETLGKYKSANLDVGGLGGRKRKAARRMDWSDLLAALKGEWTCRQDLILLSPWRDQAGPPVKGLPGKGPEFSKLVLCCLTHGLCFSLFPKLFIDDSSVFSAVLPPTWVIYMN